MRNSSRSILAECWAVLAAMFIAGSCWAAGRPVEFKIPAGAAEDSIPAFAKQSGLQTLYTQQAVGGHRTQPVFGSYEPAAALKALLQHSGLTFLFVNDHTVTIQQEDNNTGGGESPTGSRERLRPAQTDQGVSAEDRAAQLSQASGKSSELEEVIVTAQKRDERLIDVPISIAAVPGDELLIRQVTNLDDLQFVVPGLSVQQNGIGRTVELRGVSNAIGSAALVGTYLDEAAVTLSGYVAVDSSTYDLKRVEVLRGPQGTLYGEGSAGGTIRFITNDPALNAFSLSSDITASYTQDGAPGQRINLMLNAPVVPNDLAFRVVGTFARDGGWIDQPAIGRKDINGQDLTNVRVKGLWKPVEQLTVGTMAQIYRNNRSTGVGEDLSGNYRQAFDLPTSPRTRQDTDVYNVTLAYDLNVGQVLSSTTYVKAKYDTRYYGEVFPIAPPPAVPLDVYSPQYQFNDDALTEEVRLVSGGSKNWNWTVGAFYRDYRDDTLQTFNIGIPGPTPSLTVQNTSLSKSWSVFGDTSYKLTNKLTIGVGVRSFQDHQDFSDATGPQSHRFSSVDPRAYAQYQLAEQMNIYASAAKGFRSGGFNSFGQPTYGPESVWTYELGTKMSLFRSRLRLDMAVFDSQYTNYQTNGISVEHPGVSIITNEGDARIKGLELDVTWRFADKWSLSINGDYLDTEFTKIGVLFGAHTVNDQIDSVPKYQFTASAQRDFTWATKAGFVRLGFAEQGRETYRNRSVGDWFYSQSDVIRMLDLQTGIRWSGSLRMGLFAQNLLNDRGFTSPQGIFQNSTRSRPRTYGLDFSFTFD